MKHFWNLFPNNTHTHTKVRGYTKDNNFCWRISSTQAMKALRICVDYCYGSNNDVSEILYQSAYNLVRLMQQ